jgi:hypothetical protein
MGRQNLACPRYGRGQTLPPFRGLKGLPAKPAYILLKEKKTSMLTCRLFIAAHTEVRTSTSSDATTYRVKLALFISMAKFNAATSTPACLTLPLLIIWRVLARTINKMYW